MAEKGIHSLMQETMERIRSMVDVNTIVGEPITTPDGTTLIPVSKVTFGFGGGGATGVSIVPVGFLVVRDGDAHMLPVNMPAETSADRLIEMIPGAVSSVQNFVSKRRGGKSEQAAEPQTADETTEE